MKISKSGLLGLSLLFTAMWLWLIAVSVADQQQQLLNIDLDNAVQFMEKVKFISSWSTFSATLDQMGSGSVRVQGTSSNFILTQTWIDKENIILNWPYSTILWWEKNIIDGRYNVILWWEENSISGGYNVILWWERNRIKNGKQYSVILWWEDNEVEWNNAVVLWSYNTVGEGTWSTAVWMSGYVEGSHSVAMWLNSKVKANNSFLWSDGSATEDLTWDNLFVIMAENGMIINANRAHNFAKLTLWWPLVISGAENDKNIKCWTWEGGWILKIVNAENQVCLCGCDWSWRNSMLGRGRCMSICDSSIKPECDTTVKRVCDNGKILFSWSCITWKPVKWTWAYLMDKYDRVHRSCQTDDGSAVECVQPVTNKNEYFPWCQSYSCQWSVPAGAYLVEGSNQGLEGWVQNALYASESEAAWKKCAYVCDSNHKLSEDGKSCEELTYECAWIMPWENTRKWPSTTTNQVIADGWWNFVDNPLGDLWACQWSCVDARYKKVDGENSCVLEEQGECSSSHFYCEVWDSSYAETWDTEWTWKCWDVDCRECFSWYDIVIRNGREYCSKTAAPSGWCCSTRPDHAIKVSATMIDHGESVDALLCGAADHGVCKRVNQLYNGNCPYDNKESCASNANCAWFDSEFVHDWFYCTSGYVYREDCTCTALPSWWWSLNSCENVEWCQGHNDLQLYGDTCYTTCFTAWTKVTMSDGSQKNIEDIKIWEKVLWSNWSINTVLWYDRPILWNRHLWSINGSEYFVSDEHPFMTTQWWKSFNPEMTKLEIDLNTAELKIWDILVTNTGQEEIKSIDYINGDCNTPLYNFVLDGDHTYYANNYLVHNKTSEYWLLVWSDCPWPEVPIIGGSGWKCCRGSFDGYLGWRCVIECWKIRPNF